MIELLFSIVLSAIRGEITVFGIRTPFSFIAVHPSVAESFPGIPAPFNVPLCYFYNNSLSAQRCQVARLNSLVTPCKKEWCHFGMMSPPVIKTQKMYKTKKIVVIPRIALPYFHYDFWHLLGKLSKTWVMQQNARSKQIQQTSSLWRGTVHTHTRTLAASIYKHISLPFWNVIQCEPQCVLGISFRGLEIRSQELDVCPWAWATTSVPSLTLLPPWGLHALYKCIYLQSIFQLEKAVCSREGDPL